MASSEPERLSVNHVHQGLQTGNQALLVCVYPTDAYNKSHLEGAISLEDFESRLGGLDKNTEIAFY